MTEVVRQTVAWMGMEIQAPEEWDVVRFSTGWRMGTLMLVDRRHQRMQLSWRQVQRQPDMQRILSDYRSRAAGQGKGGIRFRELEGCEGWVGLVQRTDRGGLTRALRYEGQVRRLVEVVLIWPVARDAELERWILGSYRSRESSPEQGGGRWCAFGLDVQVPEGWQLEGAEANAGLAVMKFVNGRRHGEVRRLSAADDWLKESVKQWLEKQLEGVVGMRVEEVRWGGHRGAQAEGWAKEPRWRRLIGWARRRRDLAWVCPVQHAVYQVTTLGLGREGVVLEVLRVRCCEGSEGGER